MRNSRPFWRLLLSLGILALSRGVWASETYTDTPATWTGALTGPNASGHCTLECNNTTRGTNVRFHASGLTPNGAFTASWVDTDGKDRPLGMRKTELHSDERGWLDFQVRLPQCPEGDKVKIMLRAWNKGRLETVLSGTILQP